MTNKYIQNYFLFLFSIIPISIISGPFFSFTNIVLIDLSFLIFIFYKKEFLFLKDNSIKYLLLLYLYLIINSLISVDQMVGLARNLGFIRIIILFVAFNYFFKNEIFYKKVFLTWLIVMLIVSIDIVIEAYFGKNILGFTSDYGRRIVSFFKDEPIVGGYLNSFYLLLIGFLYLRFKTKYMKMILLLSIFFLGMIFLTGERSNTIKAFLAFVLFYSFFKEYSLKKKLIYFTLIVATLFTIILNSHYFKVRYIQQINHSFSLNTLYLDLYKSGYKVFENNLFFGVGNKNYRVVTCSEKYQENIKKGDYLCSTHPHQVYFEFLSEHGIIGTILILLIFYKLIISRLKKDFDSLNYIQLGSFTYLIFIFSPLLPSGAFFNDYAITLFIINLAIFYSVNPKFNIFSGKERV